MRNVVLSEAMASLIVSLFATILIARYARIYVLKLEAEEDALAQVFEV